MADEEYVRISAALTLIRPEDRSYFKKRLERLPKNEKINRCKDCRHRKVNEHYGEKGYMPIKAVCLLDSADPYERSREAENDDWFCADWEPKEDS